MKRWLNWVALVVVFSIACGFLANWQFSRRETKLAAISLVTENYKKPIRSLDEVLTNSKFELPKQTWSRVRITGHYLSDKTMLVRNRPNNGGPGFEQLVPFQTTTGLVIFVARGWLPTGTKQDSPDNAPKVSTEETILVGRVLAGEPLLQRSAPIGQIASINIPLANELAGTSAIPNGYLRMVSENPKASEDFDTMPTPSIEEGNNLSYAMQWILFALMAIAALTWRIKKDRELAKGESKPRKKSQAQRDADLEDSITTAK